MRRIIFLVLFCLLGLELVLLAPAAAHPCRVALDDSWPWSTLVVAIASVVAAYLAKPFRGCSPRQRGILLALVISLVAADLLRARHRSSLGALVLGGVESLVRRAHSGSDEQALQCLGVVENATQYGPDVATTYIRDRYPASDQVRLFSLMTRAIPGRADTFRYYVDDAASQVREGEPARR